MSESTTITPEQVAEFQRRQAESEQRRIMDAAQQIADLAKSLKVEIVGTAQLSEISAGVMGIVTSWGVRGLQ